MEEKNINTLVEVLVEKIRELQLDLTLARYERDELRRELELFKVPREHTEVKNYD